MSGRIDLRLRIAEPDVEFDHLGRPASASVRREKAAERMTFGRHPGDHRLHDLAHHARLERGVTSGTARTAHAAGVRPAVAVEDPLVILRRADRQRALAVADDKNDTSGPAGILRSRAVARRAEAPLAHGRGRRAASASARSSAITTPLPAASPSALSTTGKPKSPDRTTPAPRRAIARPETRRRHTVALHERFRERLARFEPRGRSGRSEDGGRPRQSDRRRPG